MLREPAAFTSFFASTAGNTSGAAAIEFGVVVPILSLMLIAVIDSD